MQFGHLKMCSEWKFPCWSLHWFKTAITQFYFGSKDSDPHTNLREQMMFQGMMDWVYQWLKTVYPAYLDGSYFDGYTLDKTGWDDYFDHDQSYYADLKKVCKFIVEYCGWMWT